MVVTTNAKHTTRELTATIIRLGGHYLLPVKGNAPTAYAALDALAWTKVENAQVAREKGHGRQETRTIRLVTLAGIDTTLTDVAQAGGVRRSVQRKKRRCHHPGGLDTRERLPGDQPDPPARARREGRADGARALGLRGAALAAFSGGRPGCCVTSCSARTATPPATGNGPVNLAILRNTVLTRPDGTGARPGTATLRARARKPERALSALAS